MEEATDYFEVTVNSTVTKSYRIFIGNDQAETLNCIADNYSRLDSYQNPFDETAHEVSIVSIIRRGKK